ncbi:acylphosphatase [Vineibacter terrae]|uniref:Acylphosphatase n=1 Tax=Vineibacter terrae TaxID=2586908 RepID=A0A5C8PKX3_9HYPH|nr:acylphosphatase [Vineibacter terrae]TXL74597.1 acylphosphatase [Vineibacter terrae]
MTASTDNDIIAVQARIRGRVQGVGFRDWTVRRARALGLRGWVRNRVDGSVEALFVGPRPIVDHMLADCRRGPSLARVDAVDAEPAIAPALDGFAHKPTV